jgi:cyclophilin family peptidyl-prolyl cis-trans isomerase
MYSRDLEPNLVTQTWGGLDVPVSPQHIGGILFLFLFCSMSLVQEKLKKSVVKSAGEKGVGRVTGKPLHFKGSIFHRVIPGFMAQVKFH